MEKNKNYLDKSEKEQFKSLELNINYALKPVNILFFFCGIQCYSYEGFKILPKTLHSKAYSLLLLCGNLGAFAYLIMVKIEAEPSASLYFTDNLSYVFLMCAATLSLGIPTFGNTKSMPKFLQNVKYIDKLLGLPNEYYKKLQTRVTFLFISLVFHVGFAVLVDILFLLTRVQVVYIPMYISMYIINFLLAQYVILIWIMTLRMRALISQLIFSNNLYQKPDAIDYSPNNILFDYTWNEMNTFVLNTNIYDSLDDKFLRLMTIYDKLADNFDILNSLYGPQVAFKQYISTVTVNIYIYFLNLSMWCYGIKTVLYLFVFNFKTTNRKM